VALAGGGGRALGIIHELNNALGVMVTYAMLVSEALDDRPEVAADLAEIRDAGTRAAGLVRELSDELRRSTGEGGARWTGS
jgi:signal transduction histidine kinase